jgi:hypothetical protein
MRVCIFGSRGVADAAALDAAMAAAAAAGIVPAVVLSGKEPTGVDALGERWAAARGLPVEPHPARWDDLSAPDALVRFRRGVPYNARAGPDRNRRMCAAADAGVALWDGRSPGTRGMIEFFRRAKKPVHVVRLFPNPG